MTTKSTARSARDTLINPSGILQINFLRLGAGIISKEEELCQNDLVLAKQELVTLEDSRLHIHHHDDKFHFGCVPRDQDKEEGISSDKSRVQDLARRQFLEEKVKVLETRIRRCAKTLDAFRDAKEEQRLLAKLQRFDDAHLDLCSLLFTKEQNEWINAPYTPNPFYLEDLKEPTNGGLLTRSKSEANIGSWAESIGLPYRYDDIVRIKQGNRPEPPNRWSYFADFKFPNLCAGITINEHLGAFHKNGYAEKGLERLNDYNNHIIYELPGQPVRFTEITWSFESDLRSPERFQNLVRRILLPDPI